MMKPEFHFSKRQLGLLLLMIGVIGFAGVFAVDLLDAGREGGIGPVQRVALGSLALVALFGLTMIPLGDDPA